MSDKNWPTGHWSNFKSALDQMEASFRDLQSKLQGVKKDDVSNQDKIEAYNRICQVNRQLDDVAIAVARDTLKL